MAAQVRCNRNATDRLNYVVFQSAQMTSYCTSVRKLMSYSLTL